MTIENTIKKIRTYKTKMMRLVKKEMISFLTDTNTFDMVCQETFETFGANLSDEEAESNEVMEAMTDLYSEAENQIVNAMLKAVRKAGKKKTRYILVTKTTKGVKLYKKVN